MKDPRIALILPFWQEVFKRLDLVPSYIIAVRNPFNIFKSLNTKIRIDGMPKGSDDAELGKSHFAALVGLFYFSGSCNTVGFSLRSG